MNVPTGNVPHSSYTTVDINNLGYYLDGWADLIVDKGMQAEQIRTTVVKMLQERNMPEVSVFSGSPKIKNEIRPYGGATTHPGAATTIYIGEHGKDLYVSWRTFIKPVLNDRTLIAILIASGILGIMSWLTTDSFMFFLFSFVLILSLITGLLIFFGRVFKGNSAAYFFIEPNLFDAEDITAMSLSVHKMLLRALDKEGIDTSQLRLKQSFKGGRREEDI